MFRRLGGAGLLWNVLAISLAVFTYFYGLDSQQIPKNGDEYPYEHITRLTAASGQLLPLQSELDGMRNTKPPLLFWQGIASTHWGQDWDLWHLRYPSVIYTLLTALLVFLLARKLSGQLQSGFIAALTFLAFFSTYRFGRPFLVNPPEVFWLFLPFFTLLYWRPAGFGSRLIVPLLLGIEIGIGLLYKSFALLAPIGLALAWWYLHQRRYQWREFLVKDAAKPVLAGVVALSLFALWFVVDPDPQSVWREFVIGENAGKFEAHSGSYLSQLLWGGSSIWALLLGYPMDAGLLAFPVAALFFVAYRQRHRLGDDEKLLWIWMAVLFMVFAVPSQRSARYLLEAMPGVAVLCALNWQRIPRWVFMFTLVAAGAVLMLLAFLAMSLQREIAGMYAWGYWLLLAVSLLLVLIALFVPGFTRNATNVVALLTLLSLAAFLRPFDGALGNYSETARQFVQHKDVWVPCNFRAHDEGDRFMLPSARVHGYDERWNLKPAELAARYRWFTLQLPLAAEGCAGCRVIGQRLEIRGRQSSQELQAMLKGDVLQYLFVKELLVESSNVDPALQATNKEGCR
ncbi:ArnT family glycosyltransferase [Sideroxydans lithotrophicus]|uniref:Glycosyl transferase family 39 n=1 Tax=Sideroxydans lithotrophicus (strain ES-1) TaxID=580332 RepID=D5CLH1_SIDLE|nr:phospholipid carrier-dependent glycosyltransferase [Sideroxydans lithotrophicus]ADE10559.1 glycosyl transferase family 39 [Sideroxydans lithotrophicus ES-1]